MNSQFVRSLLTIGVVLVTCGSVLAQDVKYNFAMGTDFAKYKTYRWVNIPKQNHPDQLKDQQIKAAIESDLGTKGLTKAAGDTADMLIAYQIAVDQEKQWNAYGGMGGLRFGGIGTATSSTINIGTLVFDAYDANAKQQILDRAGHQDDRSERQSGEERKEPSEGHRQAVEELPPAREEVASRELR